MSVPLPHLARRPAVPVERLRCEIKPSVHSDPRKYRHSQFIGGGEDRFDRIAAADLHPARKQLRRIERPSAVSRFRNPVSAVILLIAEQFLQDDHVHSDAVHRADQLPPVGGGEPFQLRVPEPAFFLAPVVQPAPGAVDPAGGARFGIHDFEHLNRIGDDPAAFVQQFELHFRPAGEPVQVELPYSGAPPRRIRFAGFRR